MQSGNPPTKKQKKEIIPTSHWIGYNNTFLFNPAATVSIFVNGKQIDSASYTHYFFKTFDLEKYMNKEANSILQLGASIGKFLVEQKKWGIEKKQEVDVTAYEWSEFAVRNMQQEKINARQIDLNSVDKINKQLNYLPELQIDLAKPTNIFAFRILEYLDKSTADLLVLTMMDLAKPGSVLMIGGITSPDGKTAFTTQAGHFATLFEERIKNRNDVDILKSAESAPADPTNTGRHDVDSVLVVKKK